METADVAAIPFMPLFVSDYLADTSHLSTVEHGAYLLLIMTYWQRAEALPDDDKKLARIARMTPTEWNDVRGEIADLFVVAEGLWRHRRIEQELDRARAKLEAARNAGKASAQRRFNGRSTNAQQAFNHKEVEGEREEEPNGSSTPNPFAGEAWDGWIAARKTPPTERAIELAVKKLHKLKAEGHDPVEVLDQSTMNGWTGLFPIKGRTNGADIRGGGWNGDKRSSLGRAIDRELGSPS